MNLLLLNPNCLFIVVVSLFIDYINIWEMIERVDYSVLALVSGDAAWDEDEVYTGT